MKNRLKKEPGITLIALVITVIVLLILAGVTIGLLTGENGMLNTAKNAADKYNNAAIDEQNQINNILNLIGGGTSEVVPAGFIPIYTRTDLEKVGSGEQGYEINEKIYNMNNDSNYILMNDIDLSGDNWNAITSMLGEFNGNYKMISNLNSKSNGLFYSNDGIIENINYENFNVDFNGFAGGLVEYNRGTIKNCNGNNIKVAGIYAGGISANNETGSVIEKSSIINSEMISKYAIYGNGEAIGGISARNFGEVREVLVDNLIFSSEASANEAESISFGGIVGMNDNKIKNVYSQNLKIKHIKTNNPNVMFGGISAWGGTVENVYIKYKIENIDEFGIILTVFGSGMPNNAYYLDELDQIVNYGAIKLTEVQMKQKSSFVGFDFENVWNIDENNSYPMLRAIY